MASREIRPASEARGEVRVPGSKSFTNRHLNLALLAQRPVELEGVLIADDTLAFIGALRKLGLMISGPRESLSVATGRRASEATISCGASGTMLRFLTASLATIPGCWTLDGTERLRERPMAELLDALRALGASIECLEEEGFAPLRVRGDGLDGGRVEVESASSSQFVSALLMAGLRARSPVRVAARGLVSAPYVDVTRAVIESWGGVVEAAGEGRFAVGPAGLAGGRLQVEGDCSSAAYLAAGAAILGGTLLIRGMVEASIQGDRRFLDVLAAMGVSAEWVADGLRVVGGSPLRAVEIDMSDMPDQVPTLAALAPFAHGTTRILNVPHLRIKESDRLASVAAGLRAAGASVVELDDGLSIDGTWADSRPPVAPVSIDTVNDHRIAMSFAVLGLGRPGVRIEAPGVVEKSYPDFWRDFSRSFEAK